MLKKAICLCMCLAAIGMCSCGNVDDSSSQATADESSVVSQAESNAQAETNIKYVIHYPDSATYKDVTVSSEDTAEFNNLAEAVVKSISSEPNGSSYSKKEAKETGMAGGMPLMITKYEDEKEIVTYMLFNSREPSDETVIALDYPDKDNVDGFDVADKDSYHKLCEMANELAK